MSCTVALIRDGKVYMAADSYEGNSCRRGRTRIPKLFQMRELAIGFSGDVSARNAIRYRMTVPERKDGESDEHYIAVQVVDAIRKALEEAGQLEKQNEKESAESWLLIGYRGNLYEIYSDFAVSFMDLEYAAMGAGADIARGVLFAMEGTDGEPMQILRLALMAAEEHSNYVMGPFVEAEP